MKKNVLLLGCISLFVIIVLFVVLFNTTNKKDVLQQLNFNEFVKKLDNKESFIFIIERESCSACKQYKPILKQVLIEYNLTAYYIDTDSFNEKEVDNLFKKINFSGTPTTIFFEDGEEKANTTLRIEGTANKEKIISRLKYFGYINE